jgi:glycosyltransferase involved in cell wall biosynthesis
MQILNQGSQTVRYLKGIGVSDNNTVCGVKTNEKAITPLYEQGISVITPSYKGENHISKLLDSMKNQELSYNLFEHIIVINGELDKTSQIIEDFKETNPKMNINILYSDITNVSNARNIAINEANREYSTLIDDDDYISPKFLEELYINAKENRIVISRLTEVDEDGNFCYSAINKQIENKHGVISNPYVQMSSLLTFNACKLIPTHNLKQIKFNVDLSSGEDIEFFCKLIISQDFEYYVLKEEDQAIYYRVLRSNSLSRRITNYKFNIVERLAVIMELNNVMLKTNDLDKEKFIKQKIRAQTSFLNKYLLKYPDDIQRVREDIKSLNLDYFSYYDLNRNLAKKLIISYCFLPYVDISAVVMAKRIRDHNVVVDVIQNNMDGMRTVDKNSNLITEELIENQIVINSKPSFGNWNHIHDFCKKGMEKINKIVREKGEYTEIYSRAMFPPSHFLAFEYKIKYPNVKWTAEFSDPLIYDIKGNVRDSKINNQEFMDKVNNLLSKRGLPKDEYGNLFFLCEYLTYVFADELIFTNENQKEYMISKFPNQEIVDIIEQKSRINKHSTLKKDFYNLIESDYLLDNNYVNLAYFGAFYETRNLENVFHALYALNNDYKKKCKIHFFTSDVEGFKESMECSPIMDNLEVNSYVSFLEFLNLTTKFDCLIVNDAHTKEYKKINPYLPSKLSDYLGSGTDIWTVCEEGSVMSKYNLKYKSTLDDIKSTRATLKKIIEDHS